MKQRVRIAFILFLVGELFLVWSGHIAHAADCVSNGGVCVPAPGDICSYYLGNGWNYNPNYTCTGSGGTQSCCTQSAPPDCNTGVSCGGCNFTEPGNACGTVAGSQWCQYNNYSGGGSCNVNGWYQTCYGSYNNCNAGWWCSGGQCITWCSQGAINCNACGGGSEPVNTCGTIDGSQTCTHDAPQVCQDSAFTRSCNYFYDRCSNNYTCTNGNTCTTNIHVHVYVDYNHDGTSDSGDNGFSGVIINDNGGNTPQTDGNGNVTFTTKTSGNYTITAEVPANYQSTTTDPYHLTLGTGNGDPTINFGMTPLYSISGTVYNDVNEDFYYNNPPDAPYTGGGTVTATGPTTETTNLSTTDGSYAFTNLLSGQYTVTYSPPTNYHAVYPVPPQFTVVVGPPSGAGGATPCTANNAHNASCGATGDVTGLDFGISNANAWNQGVCTNTRVDGVTAGGKTSGGFTDLIPASANCGGTASPYAVIANTGSGGGGNPPYAGTSCTDPGVVFTGNTDADFGEGAANVNNWVIGGNTYGEVFTPRTQGVIATSYEALTANFAKTGSTTTDLSTVCTLNNCTLPPGLPDGIYQANGNVTLNAYTFPASTDSQIHAYIFHINGTLTLDGNIIAPAGTVDLLATTGNITVDPTVGESDVTSTTGDIEGLFTTDQSFIIASSYAAGNHCDATTGNPKDLKLNIQGAVITNATNTGGSFQVERDLCNQNRSCPTLTVQQRADMLLSLPQVVRNTNTLFQEVAP